MPSHTHKPKKQIAYVLDVDMGYGHSRAAYALRDLSHGTVITANNYHDIPEAEKELWKVWRQGYETLSRLRPVPLIGKAAFEIVEKLQEIPEFYPRRDLSRESFALHQAMQLIEKRGLGRHLVETLNKRPLPAVCTHPIPAFALEAFGYLGEIWCVPTDADVARAWVSPDPKQSKIKYLCANGRLMERLQLYGVPVSQLFLTGFPLPKELIGGPKESTLKRDLLARLCNLDPKRVFINRYKQEIAQTLGRAECVFRSNHPLTITYSVGGAGAQRAIGVEIMKSLKMQIKRQEVRLILLAGTRRDVSDYYAKAARDLHLAVPILHEENRTDYFETFNAVMQETDVLWTKPSELSFYTGLGIPIIMAPPLGRQEEFNAIWLTYVGGGVHQDDVRYVNEWLFDWLDSGGLARAAWQGYTQAPTHGTYRIEDIVQGRTTELLPPSLIV